MPDATDDDVMDRRDFRAVACLIAFFNTHDPDEAIWSADELAAKFYGDTPVPPKPIDQADRPAPFRVEQLRNKADFDD